MGGTFPFKGSIAPYYQSLLNPSFIAKVQEYSIQSDKIITGKAWTPQNIIYPSSTIDNSQIGHTL
ncbi:hypothetical protein HK103_001575 [Boothiomyces macroporosus]|uniref:Uncharacterized protein n=1 Tax=Boothiomyces macroporosus TaxID=261099 RepID=A0AAD5UED4_9FUNG|nr:hypothetical protein HK103_001575 [Boothiomyces macroporosus]